MMLLATMSLSRSLVCQLQEGEMETIDIDKISAEHFTGWPLLQFVGN